MRTAASWSTSGDAGIAVKDAFNRLKRELGGNPDWMVVHATANLDSRALVDTLSAVAGAVPWVGGTSCQGVMTGEGFHEKQGVGLGLFGVRDTEGRYSVGIADAAIGPRIAGAAATRKAISGLGEGNAPQLIHLLCAPGSEEEVLRGIADAAGPHVPVAGGSSADNAIEGKWRQFAGGREFRDGIIVTALSPSRHVFYSFWSGYCPTKRTGTVTESSGRTIQAIDGRPAARVYNEWTDGIITDFLGGGNVLAHTSLHPLGHPVKKLGCAVFYRLSHPEAVTQGEGLRVFTEVGQGEEIALMQGSRTSLIARAGIVSRSALRCGCLRPDQVAGALVFFCAGCMLTIKDRMHEVVSNIRATLGNAPFLGAFTFGEQGCLVDGVNHHGNLMISVVVFANDLD